MKKDNIFFDIHMHAFNLSHAGLLAFVNRAIINSNLTLKDIYDKKIRKILGVLLKALCVKIWKNTLLIFKRKEKHESSLARFVNILSLFENDITRQFQYLELDYLLTSNNEYVIELIKGIKDPFNYQIFSTKLKKLWEETDKNLFIAGKEFKKVVLIPLMMDFNSKGFSGLDDEKIHYHLAPRKPIINQSVDLFTGIKQYYAFSEIQLFEIYPFMAINTENLEFGDEDIRYSNKTLEDILDKHFKEFSKSDSGIVRYKYLSKKLDKLRKPADGDEIRTFNPLDSSFYYFAGIKVYPPLGFDPWPDGEGPESEHKIKKVRFFYNYCCERNIPITTHCSNGGFKVSKKENALLYTNPERWIKVLENYPTLKINFAHDGIHDGSKVESGWNRTILEFVIKYDNVFFDIADNVCERNYFKRLFNFIKIQNFSPQQLEKISTRMLFGTDFMMLLLGSKSYYEYLSSFSETEDFENAFVDKNSICNKNSYEFIFGK